MTRQTKSYRHSMRPYLASDEVLRLTGISRRMLNTIIEFEICTPYRDEEHNGTLSWTPGHVDLIRQVTHLRNLGMGFSDIKELLKRDDGSFETAVDRADAEATRRQRRNAKRLHGTRRMTENMSAIKKQQGFYLRYVPQRWMAILPLPGSSVLSPNATVKASLALEDIAEHVGWAPSGINGTLFAAPSPSTLGRFAFIGLASQPQPASFPNAGLDSGCYCAAGGICEKTGNADCLLCPSFGKEITSNDELAWKSYENENDAADCTLSFDKIERPYPCGPWSNLTAEWIKDGKLSNEGWLDTVAAARPRLMPQLQRLPLGATACVMPAGIYLCKQCSAKERASAVAEFSGFTRAVRHRDLTVAEEKETAARYQRLVESMTPATGEVWATDSSEVCIDDPAQKGWFRPLADADIPDLVVTTATGLVSGSEFTISCVKLPQTNYDELPDYEVQVLIDASSILASNDESEHHGLISAIRMPMRKKTVARQESTCRICGAHLPLQTTDGVALCERCGHAQPVGDTESRSRSLWLKAEDQRCRGEYKEGLQTAQLACTEDPSDTEAHWTALLCRNGVEFKTNPSNGHIAARLAHPADAPIESDDDYVAILKLASDEQWEAYRRLADLVEQGRQEALGLDEQLLSMDAHIGSEE